MDAVFSLLLFFPAASVSLSASWKPVASTVAPPRSGPTAGADGKGSVWLFGGYAEEAGERRVVNDLLHFGPDGWTPLQEDGGEARPGPRLASASAVLDGELLVFGGWDPQVPGTGGVILDDVWALELDTLSWSRCESPMPCGPTSRHTAAVVGGRLIVHTFRCAESVLVWDAKARVLREQPTTGTPPSARGLHVAAAADERTLVVFGGAAKGGEMCADAFALDVVTWQWRPLCADAHADAADDGVLISGPSARAGACAAPLPGGGGIVVCCGAEAGADRLEPRADVWALTLAEGGGKWERLLADDAPNAPGPRNAATLSPLAGGGGGSGQLLLHGGWRPFVSTYGDSHVLTVSP